MDLPNRKSPRLSGFDYSTPNCYFVTICTHNKAKIFGEPDRLNDCGIIAKNELLNLAKRYDNVKVNCFVVMPNHIHALFIIDDDKLNTPSLTQIIGLYKSGVSKLIHRKYPDLIVWQGSFYDKIIKSNESFLHARKYIYENPEKWKLNQECLNDENFE